MKRWMTIGLVLLGSCAPGPDPMGHDEVTPSLLASLGIASALQLQADELEALGDVPGAVERVEEILAIEFPEDASDREDVRIDAYGRIAELELARGDIEAARAALARGRGEASRDSYFHARLLLVVGRADQAHAAVLREAGDASGARTASLAAIESLEASIAMNQRVLAASSTAEGNTP